MVVLPSGLGSGHCRASIWRGSVFKNVFVVNEMPMRLFFLVSYFRRAFYERFLLCQCVELVDISGRNLEKLSVVFTCGRVQKQENFCGGSMAKNSVCRCAVSSGMDVNHFPW